MVVTRQGCKRVQITEESGMPSAACSPFSIDTLIFDNNTILYYCWSVVYSNFKIPVGLKFEIYTSIISI